MATTHRKQPRLGELLILAGKIDKDQLDQAVELQKTSGERIGTGAIPGSCSRVEP